MLALACLTVGVVSGHYLTLAEPVEIETQVLTIAQVERAPEYITKVEYVPQPYEVIREVEVIKEVPVTLRKFENTEELLRFVKWLKLNVPFQPFGDHRCGLDADLVQQLAWAQGYNVNVDITENGKHLILNAVMADGDVYTMYPPYYGIHKAGYIKGWHEYNENLWREIVG